MQLSTAAPTLPVGAEITGLDGPIGTVTALYDDDETGRPSWFAVRLPASEFVTFVPACRVTGSGINRPTIPLPVAVVRAAPAAPVGVEDLGLAFEDALYHYYAAALSTPLGVAAG